MNERKAYPSDLTDEQWRHLRIWLPRRRGRGRSPKHNPRDLVNAILYVLRTGCQWRALPHDFPPWQPVYDFFRKLCREGVWQRMNDQLRAEVRQQAGRQVDPSVVIIDSQSVKTTEKGAHAAMTGASKSKDANDRSRWM